MQEVAAKRAHRSPVIFTRRSWSANAAAQTAWKGWPRPTDMFDGFFSESQARIDKLTNRCDLRADAAGHRIRLQRDDGDRNRQFSAVV